MDDAGLPPSDAAVPLAVDFTVQNCPAFDPTAMTCTGQVPLALRFVPLSTAPLGQYLWSFDDGSISREATPEHIYVTPGRYSVTIVATAVAGGVVSKSHAKLVVALPSEPGELCDRDFQCENENVCICGADLPCAAGPTRGLCAASCAGGRCGAGQVCAGLHTADSPVTPEPWQTDLCLPVCAANADCLPGLSCRTLPPGPSGTAWVRACFSAVPADLGEPCRDTVGRLRDDLCATGLCADLGSLGMCTMPCQKDTSCPLGSDCALLGDGRSLCLRSCASFACDRDPLLTCMAPNPGDLGYQLASSGTANAGSYCAPKYCNDEQACLGAGICQAKHCVRRL